MTRVLVVEDDPALRRSLVVVLGARGYDVFETGNGEDALLLAGRHLPDVVLLDLGLPTISGIQVIEGLRSWTDVPVIVLSARGAEADKVGALDAGANDYVTKPFGIEELLARLRAAERILRHDAPVVAPIVTPHFTLDLLKHELRSADGTLVRLTPIEWALVGHLVGHHGNLVTRTELLRAVWGPEYERKTNYLRVHLTHLRKKLEPNPSDPIYLLTEVGSGYRFVVPT